MATKDNDQKSSSEQMKKSKDTGQLIKAITMDMDKTDGMLDRLKKERSSGMETDQTGETADLTNNAITGTPEKKVPLGKDPDDSETPKDGTVVRPMKNVNRPSKGKKMTKSEERIWQEFNKTVESEFYRDKKDVFQMSLSGECLAGYERLALGLGYKMGKKINRNEILRKVLEEFVHKNGAKLEKLIEKL